MGSKPILNKVMRRVAVNKCHNGFSKNRANYVQGGGDKLSRCGERYLGTDLDLVAEEKIPA